MARTRSRTSLLINEPQQDFFRVVLPHTLEQNKLRLPKKFVSRYGSELSSTATLSLPNGPYAWNVGVEKIKEEGQEREEVWFGHGWGEFMGHYSISNGFFLVFHYQGNSAFDVQIFDLTTCSILYPPPPTATTACSDRKGNIRDDEVIILDDEEEEEEGDHKPRTGEEVTGGNKRRRTQMPASCGGIEKTLGRLKASGIATSAKLQHTMLKTNHRVSSRKCIKGIEEALLSNPKNPSFIIVLMRGQMPSSAMIPTSFGKEHIQERWSNLILQMGTGMGIKQWSVEVERVMKCWPKTYFEMRGGWLEFRNDNSLDEGGVCLFQLLSPDEPVMDVSIFPVVAR